MAVEELFKQALGLIDPWKVISCDFDQHAKRLLIKIDFKSGSQFADGSTEELCKVHDTVTRRWEHLKFFEHRTILEARVPRIKNSKGKVTTVKVPWAEPHSGFTLLMEAYMLGLARVLPVAEVARLVGVSEDRIWRLLRARVKDAWEQTDWKSLERLGVDETSTKKGHKYGTAFLEIDGVETSRGKGGSKVARLLFFTEGKGKETFKAFGEELDKRGIDRKNISEIAMDMSPSFISGAGTEFADSQICFDHFHVMKLCGEACEQVRKDVIKEHGSLPKGAMWVLRGNAGRLKDDQKELREQLCREYAQIGRSHAIKEFLRDTWNYATRELAEGHLKAVISWCQRSRLQPFVKLARTLKRHSDGIMGYYKNFTTSAAIEAINGLLQLARRRARGYKCFANFSTMAYWIAGRLELATLNTVTH